MTERHASVRRVIAVARVRLRYLIRSRVVVVAFLLAILPWFAVDRHDIDAEMGLLTGSALVGMLATASGVVSESLDDGAYCIALLHGASPLDVLVGECVGALTGMSPIAVGFLYLSAPAFDGNPVIASILILAWLCVLVLGWLGAMLWLGTILPGKGNAIAMIPLLLAFAFPADALPVDSWPPLLASTARTLWNAMPLQSHATAMYAAILHDSTPPPLAPLALLVAPPLFLALAALQLSRLEAAGRIAR